VNHILSRILIRQRHEHPSRIQNAGNFLGVEERPATGQNPVTAIRLSDKMRESVDAWAGRQDDTPNRSEAIRRLVELGLKVKVKCS